MEFNYKPGASILIGKRTVEHCSDTFFPDGTFHEAQQILNFFMPALNAYNMKLNIVDVGAQAGSYSLFSKFLPNSFFYSFEPFPKSFELLNENIKLNNLENIQTFQFAVSDREGTAVLNTCTSHNGLHTMGKTPNFTANPINIETRTLDNLFKDVPFHLLKIDTEGHEFFVLSGGINVIRKYKPIIQIEWSPHNMRQCGITQTMLMSIIEILDYRIANLFEEEMIIVPR